MEDNKTQSLFTREITSVPEKKNQVRCMGCMEEFSARFSLCPECGYIIGTPPKLKSYLRPGLILSGRYMLGRVIGQGGFGITYIGWDEKEKRKVAVKEFFPSALSTREDGETNIICYNGKAEQYFREGIKKMLDEGNRLSKYGSNPNIVNVYDYFEENGTAYIVMEYLEGESLKEYAAEKGGRLEPREAVNLMIPVIGALEEMHKENMIHRDIAPDNVYLCKDGKIKLLDFGSARIAVQDAEKSLSVMVKPGYAPKEQYASRSKQGPWTDVYSVCATIYKLVTGESPVESIERENTPLKTFAEFGIENENDLEKILFQGLEPEPKDRIQTAEKLKALLLKNVLADNTNRISAVNNSVINNEQSSSEAKKSSKKWEVVSIISMALTMALPIGIGEYGVMSFYSIMLDMLFSPGWFFKNFIDGLSDGVYIYSIPFMAVVALFNISFYKLRKTNHMEQKNQKYGTAMIVIYNIISVLLICSMMAYWA